MKRIGFIDYYLDEWHANNYPGWIRDICRSSSLDCDVSYAWADVDMPGGLDTAAWCGRYGVEALSSIEELVEKSDYIIVLSPDNPENHERLSRIPLMSGKPVYVDKTFSQDLASGVRMFELAAKYGTPMFSSSALRYAAEFAGYPDDRVNPKTLEYVTTMGPGTFENYSVHQFEMIVSLLGTGAARIKSLSAGNGRLLFIEYEDGRRASMHQLQEAPFQASLQLNDGSGIFISQCSDIFTRLISSILYFFETGKPTVPSRETLQIMALIEAGAKALGNYDSWIKVEHV